MPRIPYQPIDLQEPADLVAAVRARRGGTLINLDRMLLHSAPLTRGWNAYLGEVRRNLDASPKLREMAICAVAVLNYAEYEYIHHVHEFTAAGGTQEQADALRDMDQAVNDARLFDETERAVLALTVEMTRQVKVSDATFARMRTHLSNTHVVEIVGTIATYNMVSRFLVALGVEPE